MKLGHSFNFLISDQVNPDELVFIDGANKICIGYKGRNWVKEKQMSYKKQV